MYNLFFRRIIIHLQISSSRIRFTKNLVGSRWRRRRCSPPSLITSWPPRILESLPIFRPSSKKSRSRPNLRPERPPREAADVVVARDLSAKYFFTLTHPGSRDLRTKWFDGFELLDQWFIGFKLRILMIKLHILMIRKCFLSSLAFISRSCTCNHFVVFVFYFLRPTLQWKPFCRDDIYRAQYWWYACIRKSIL